MKKIIVFFLLFLIAGTLLAGSRPKEVSLMIKGFELNPFYSQRAAWARLNAWGTGKVQGREFVWLAWTNTDGLVTFDLSLLLPKEVEKKIQNLKDQYGRSYEVYPLILEERKCSCIATSNDWLDVKTDKKFNPVKIYIKKLKKTGLNLELKEFLK